MKEEKDKILDDLFKKKLGEPGYQEAFNEADWLSLEEKLDNVKKKRGIIFWLPIISTAAVLLIFLGVWVFYKKASQFNQGKEQPLVSTRLKNDSVNNGINNPKNGVADKGPSSVSNHLKNKNTGSGANNNQGAIADKNSSLVSTHPKSNVADTSSSNNQGVIVDKNQALVSTRPKNNTADASSNNQQTVVAHKKPLLVSTDPKSKSNEGANNQHTVIDSNNQLAYSRPKSANKKIRKSHHHAESSNLEASVKPANRKNHQQAENSNLEASIKPANGKHSSIAKHRSPKWKRGIDQDIDKPNDELSSLTNKSGQFFDRDTANMFAYNQDLGIKAVGNPLLIGDYDLTLDGKLLVKTLAVPSSKLKPKKQAKETSPGIFIQPVYALTVIGATELNGVNSFQQSRSGSDYGAFFSAEIINRLTVSSGASYSIKPYNANYNNYHTDHSFYIDPTTVQADCKVLDIPLNFDYRIFNGYLNKISAGIGLSSYIMLHENYTFNYPAGSGVNQFNYTVANTNKYFFGVMNFQATYVRQINPNFGISLQPYLKLPLAGISAGQVNLQTTGLALGVTWNLNPY